MSAALQYVRCKWCGHRWAGVRAMLSDAIAAAEPLPGKDLACPQCGLAGSTIVLDFDPQEQLL